MPLATLWAFRSGGVAVGDHCRWIFSGVCCPSWDSRWQIHATAVVDRSLFCRSSWGNTVMNCHVVVKPIQRFEGKPATGLGWSKVLKFIQSVGTFWCWVSSDPRILAPLVVHSARAWGVHKGVAGSLQIRCRCPCCLRSSRPQEISSQWPANPRSCRWISTSFDSKSSFCTCTTAPSCRKIPSDLAIYLVLFLLVKVDVIREYLWALQKERHLNKSKVYCLCCCSGASIWGKPFTTLCTPGPGTTRTSGLVSMRRSLPGFSYSNGEMQGMQLLQLSSNPPKLRQRHFKMWARAQTCHFPAAMRSAPSFMTTLMVTARNIDGVLFGWRHLVGSSRLASGWSWYSFSQSKLLLKFRADFCLCWWYFPCFQLLAFSWSTALACQSHPLASPAWLLLLAAVSIAPNAWMLCSKAFSGWQLQRKRIIFRF